MTKRKAIVIIFMLILAVVLLTGCSANQPEPNESSDLWYSYAMVRMPDGSIVQGLCSVSAFSYGTAMVVIDNVRYRTGAENVVVWK